MYLAYLYETVNCFDVKYFILYYVYMYIKSIKNPLTSKQLSFSGLLYTQESSKIGKVHFKNITIIFYWLFLKWELLLVIYLFIYLFIYFFFFFMFEIALEIIAKELHWRNDTLYLYNVKFSEVKRRGNLVTLWKWSFM